MKTQGEITDKVPDFSGINVDVFDLAKGLSMEPLTKWALKVRKFNNSNLSLRIS